MLLSKNRFPLFSSLLWERVIPALSLRVRFCNALAL